MWSDPAVTRFIGGKPSTEQQTWFRVLQYIGHWSVMDFGYWVIEEKSSGLFAGEIGFADFKRDIAPSMRSAPEVGWALASRFHGMGFATEALRGVLDWADQQAQWPRTVCLISPDNLQSIKVATKCGYHEFERTSFNEAPVLFFEREK
jgi:RimJ/RimL family protein N-acetyltransferase